MTIKKKTVKTILVFLALVAIILLGWLVLFQKPIKIPKEISNPKNIIPENVIMPQIIQAPEGALIQGFPDIPLNGKKELTSSYALKYSGVDQERKVVDFTSSKSVKENFDFYKNWAEKNNWNILGEPYNENEARLILEKDSKFLNITIQKDEKETSKVNINYY